MKIEDFITKQQMGRFKEGIFISIPYNVCYHLPPVGVDAGGWCSGAGGQGRLPDRRVRQDERRGQDEHPRGHGAAEHQHQQGRHRHQSSGLN